MKICGWFSWCHHTKIWSKMNKFLHFRPHPPVFPSQSFYLDKKSQCRHLGEKNELSRPFCLMKLFPLKPILFLVYSILQLCHARKRMVFFEKCLKQVEPLLCILYFVSIQMSEGMPENSVSGVRVRTASYPIFIRLGRTRNQTKWGNGWSITKQRRNCSYLWLCWAPACWLVMVCSLLPFQVIFCYHYLRNIEVRYVSLKQVSMYDGVRFAISNKETCDIWEDSDHSVLGSFTLPSLEQLHCSL